MRELKKGWRILRKEEQVEASERERKRVMVLMTIRGLTKEKSFKEAGNIR